MISEASGSMSLPNNKFTGSINIFGFGGIRDKIVLKKGFEIMCKLPRP